MAEDDPPAGESAQTESASRREETNRDGAGSQETVGQSDEEARPEQAADREALLTDVRTIDGRIRWKWALRTVVSAAVLGVIVGAVTVIGLEWGPLAGVGMFVIATFVGIAHVLLLYRSWEYELREDALYLQRGVLTEVKTVVPFVRVQHIDTSRGPVDRAIGLSSLVVYTAGSRGADVTIPGLKPSDAEDLQDRLKVLAKDSAGDDAV